MQTVFVSLSPARSGRSAVVSGSQLAGKGSKVEMMSAHNHAGSESLDMELVDAIVEEIFNNPTFLDWPCELQLGVGNGSVLGFEGFSHSADAGMTNTIISPSFYAPPTEAMSLSGDAELINATEAAEALFGPGDVFNADPFRANGGRTASENAPAVDTEVVFSFQNLGAFQQHVAAALDPQDAEEAYELADLDGGAENGAQSPAPEAPVAAAEEGGFGTCPGCGKTRLSLTFRGRDSARRDKAWMGSHRMPGRRPGALRARPTDDTGRGLHCPASREYRARVFQ